MVRYWWKLWWCDTGQRQTRLHLFSHCRRWAPQIRDLWLKIDAVTGGGPRAPAVRRLFRPEATQAVLDFLRDTSVGRLPRLVPFGIMEQGSSGDLELWAESEGSESEGEEGEPGPP